MCENTIPRPDRSSLLKGSDKYNYNEEYFFFIVFFFYLFWTCHIIYGRKILPKLSLSMIPTYF